MKTLLKHLCMLIMASASLLAVCTYKYEKKLSTPSLKQMVVRDWTTAVLETKEVWHYYWLKRVRPRSNTATMVYTGTREVLPSNGGETSSNYTKTCSSTVTKNCYFFSGGGSGFFNVSSFDPFTATSSSNIVGWIRSAYTQGALWGGNEQNWDSYGLRPFYRNWSGVPSIYNSNYHGWALLRARGASVTTHTCPSGYTLSGDSCYKDIAYNFTSYSCDSSDLNSQGFGWKLTSSAISDGIKIDPDTQNVNHLGSDMFSHASQPECKRKYQQCTIECQSPLVLNSEGRCVISYEDECAAKGMQYNSETLKCEKDTQCGNDLAFKDFNSDYCAYTPNCDVINGMCGEEPTRNCEDGFFYSEASKKCEKAIECDSTEYVTSNGECKANPFCNEGDIEESTKCLNIVEVTKSCGIDARSGNLCYVSSGEGRDVTYKRPLIKTELKGSYKEAGYYNTLGILCTNDDQLCAYRLTKIYSDNEGKSLCFEDAQGVSSCIETEANCLFSGSVELEDGIKQLKTSGGKTILAYNKLVQDEPIGSIGSTCEISGKVGSFEGQYIASDITAVVTDGLNIKFGDRYQRGFIGNIALLPTIPQADFNEGFTYADADTFTLYQRGFTSFYSEDNETVYAVYKDMISKSECESLIADTNYFIVQPLTSHEADILEGLSLKSGSSYNYRDGDLNSGSCVIKSTTSQSFDNQEYSYKIVKIEDASSVFACSPYVCNAGSCQTNSCPIGYVPTLFEQDYFDSIYYQDFPTKTEAEACVDMTCDQNAPHFRYCGNEYGCPAGETVYQQSDGTCVSVTCDAEESLDPVSGKCVSYGCVNSVERDGKCYRSLY